MRDDEMREAHKLVIVAVLSSLLGACEWYRARERAAELSGARGTVEQWRAGLELPRTDGNAELDRSASIWIVVGPQTVGVHNLGAVDQLEEAKPSALSNMGGDKFADQFIHLEKGIELTVTDEVESDAAPLRDAVREVMDTNERIGTAMGEQPPKTLEVWADRQLSYPKFSRVLYAAGDAGCESMRLRVSPSSPSGAAYLADFAPELCLGVDGYPDEKKELCVVPDIVRTSRGTFVVVSGALRRLDRSEPVSCLRAIVVEEGLGVEIDRSGPAGLLGAHDRLVLSGGDGACPPIRSREPAVDEILALLDRVDERIPICGSINISASSDVPWGKVAPILGGLQEQEETYAPFLGFFDGAPSCSDAVPVSELEAE